MDGLRRDVATEGGGPAFGGQFPDAPLGMGGDAQQDVLEVVERRDADQRAALHERVQQCRPNPLNARLDALKPHQVFALLLT